MSKIVAVLLMFLSPMASFAKIDCNIQVVLSSESFFAQDFKDVKDGFTFGLRNYEFLFRHNTVTDESTMTIEDLASKKIYTKTTQIEKFQPLYLDVYENGRSMASAVCNKRLWD